MTRSLCVPFLCALFALPAHAGSVEFAQWIPWDFLSQELKKKEFILNEKESTLTLTAGELKPILKNIELDVRGVLSTLNVRNSEISISGSGSIYLTIGSFHIDQMVVRVFGGNVLQVHLKADCAATVIEIPTLNLQTLFSLKETRGWLPELTDINLEIPGGAWKASPVQCEGLSGIAQEVENQLNLALNNPAQFSNLLRESLSPFLEKWVNDKWVSIRSTEGQWENLRLDPPEEKGFLVRGDLPLSGNEEVYLPSSLPAEMKSNSPRFFLSREGFAALIQDHIRKSIPAMYDLRENDGFKSLLKSRAMQFLVWPELRRFHTATPFILRNDASSFKLSLTQNGVNWKADLAGNGNLTTLIGGSPIDYLTYRMSISVPATMILKDGDLRLSTGKASAKLSWSFGHLYQFLYKPDKRLPVNILTNALATMAGEKSQVVFLPRFSTGEKEYMLSNLKVQDQLITMDWL